MGRPARSPAHRISKMTRLSAWMSGVSLGSGVPKPVCPWWSWLQPGRTCSLHPWAPWPGSTVLRSVCPQGKLVLPGEWSSFCEVVFNGVLSRRTQLSILTKNVYGPRVPWPAGTLCGGHYLWHVRGCLCPHKLRASQLPGNMSAGNCLWARGYGIPEKAAVACLD